VSCVDGPLRPDGMSKCAPVQATIFTNELSAFFSSAVPFVPDTPYLPGLLALSGEEISFFSPQNVQGTVDFSSLYPPASSIF